MTKFSIANTNKLERKQKLGRSIEDQARRSISIVHFSLKFSLLIENPKNYFVDSTSISLLVI